jgi:hypothetical protein
MSFCSHCGGNLAFVGAKFCAHCGKPQSSTSGPIAVAAAPARAIEPSKEVTFYDDRSVTVTNTRFVVPGQTFPVAGITSIANTKDAPSAWPILGVLIGVVLCIGGMIASNWGTGGCGLVLIALSIWIAIASKPIHHVLLHTAGGEVRALSSQDPEFITDVVIALNQSIIRRG